MGKRIIITAGPTNERIDAVMKITNMSTGTLGSVIADTFLDNKFGEIDKIYFVSTKMSRTPVYIHSSRIERVVIESTQDLIEALEDIFVKDKIDFIIHSAAVGDYAGKYVIRAEDLIEEIIQKQRDKVVLSRETLMEIFENPQAVQNDETKISSYEPHLMTMLTLTPKVIGKIKQMSPDTKLVGFKLLEGVTEEELYQVADRLRKKNDADFIVANDLARIGNGKHWAMIINKDGIYTQCQTKQEIALALQELLF